MALDRKFHVNCFKCEVRVPHSLLYCACIGCVRLYSCVNVLCMLCVVGLWPSAGQERRRWLLPSGRSRAVSIVQYSSHSSADGSEPSK